VRGYGRLQARQELEDAWNHAVGEPYCQQTQLGEVRRGVLNVTVGHSTLLEELAAFRKPALLAALRSSALATPIHDIRFRIGAIRPATGAECGHSSKQEAVDPHRRSARGQHGEPGTKSNAGGSYGYDSGQ
jgi:Dna[CI] antecedent, DciA